MTVPLSERTVEIQFTDEYDDTLEDRIASLLAGIVGGMSAEEIESFTAEDNTEQFI